MAFEKENFSRRNFLGAGAATLAGLALAPSRGFAAGPPAAAAPAVPAAADLFDGLPLGVQSYTFRDRSVEKALEAIAKDLKLRHVEFYPGHLTGHSPKQVKELLAAHGVTATALGVVHFGKDAEANRKHFELAK